MYEVKLQLIAFISSLNLDIFFGLSGFTVAICILIIMASALLTCSLSNPIRASSGSGSRKPDSSRIKLPSSSSSATTWWAPLFGWSSDPDYISNSNRRKQPETVDLDNKSGSGRPVSRYSLGCFTEEKAKQLRRKTMESSSFHDVMYHSAIASRLASDISVWSDK